MAWMSCRSGSCGRTAETAALDVPFFVSNQLTSLWRRQAYPRQVPPATVNGSRTEHHAYGDSSAAIRRAEEQTVRSKAN
ncbi:hypothetical protein IG631_17550 [Alternaria alternata]|jgi:hypothetical protein|nr:hypothetical protein IG631_17550 [Alternaria alternata]